ncbi:unnamed protein product [Phytomonas sp. Hart1]|nr:unnamed protein product [Phytomonas sp. Hart1]|eukprot:CCW68910.1 unnamed protein product [Phytomonas sp. isolate Hart1]
MADIIFIESISYIELDFSFLLPQIQHLFLLSDLLSFFLIFSVSITIFFFSLTYIDTTRYLYLYLHIYLFIYKIY